MCGEQVLHDMNDWPRFMNNDSVSGRGESLKSTHFSLSLISLSYLGHMLFGCSPLVCFFAFCFAFSFLFICYSITLPHGVIFFVDSLCLFLFLPLFISFFLFVYTPCPPYRPTRVSVLVVNIAQTEEMVHLLEVHCQALSKALSSEWAPFNNTDLP